MNDHHEPESDNGEEESIIEEDELR